MILRFFGSLALTWTLSKYPYCLSIAVLFVHCCDLNFHSFIAIAALYCFSVTMLLSHYYCILQSTHYKQQMLLIEPYLCLDAAVAMCSVLVVPVIAAAVSTSIPISFVLSLVIVVYHFFLFLPVHLCCVSHCNSSSRDEVMSCHRL